MSIWVTLNMTANRGTEAELNAFLEAKLPAVRGFEGALSVTVFGNDENRELLIVEEWKSRQHHEAYIAAITENGVMNDLVSFMTGPPAVRYFDRRAM
jgi:quinol monooxygenase YgiN